MKASAHVMISRDVVLRSRLRVYRPQISFEKFAVEQHARAITAKTTKATTSATLAHAISGVAGQKGSIAKLGLS